jgi:hypothetical protein
VSRTDAAPSNPGQHRGIDALRSDERGGGKEGRCQKRFSNHGGGLGLRRES